MSLHLIIYLIKIVPKEIWSFSIEFIFAGCKTTLHKARSLLVITSIIFLSVLFGIFYHSYNESRFINIRDFTSITKEEIDYHNNAIRKIKNEIGKCGTNGIYTSKMRFISHFTVVNNVIDKIEYDVDFEYVFDTSGHDISRDGDNLSLYHTQKHINNQNDLDIINQAFHKVMGTYTEKNLIESGSIILKQYFTNPPIRIAYYIPFFYESEYNKKILLYVFTLTVENGAKLTCNAAETLDNIFEFAKTHHDKLAELRHLK